MAKRIRAPKVSVDVDQDIINQSVSRDSSHCMIAEAVKAAYPNAKYVSVDVQTIRFTDQTCGLRFTYLTPRAAQVNIVKFDQGIKPEPFQILLRNGHVTSSGSRQRRTDKPLSEAQRLQRHNATRASRAAHKRNRLKIKTHTSGAVPSLSGGRPAPRDHRRRSFGLRGLEY